MPDEDRPRFGLKVFLPKNPTREDVNKLYAFIKSGGKTVNIGDLEENQGKDRAPNSTDDPETETGTGRPPGATAHARRPPK